MKIAIVGSWAHDHCEKFFSKSLEKFSIEIVPFKLSDYFKGRLGNFLSALPLPSPLLYRINRELMESLLKEEVDVAFFWNCNHILPSSLKRLREKNVKIVAYNNDDPFGSVINNKKPLIHFFQFFWYLNNLKLSDINLVYRPQNIKEAQGYSSSSCIIRLFTPYFIPELHKETNLKLDRCSTDVVFIGHYEDDFRLDCIEYLCENGIDLSLYGTGWNHLKGSKLIKKKKIVSVYGKKYEETLASSKICLSFLSKMNRDVYTRRCFEIPAMKKLLLCERSEEMLEMYVEDKEAVFFSDKLELLEKVKWLLANPIIINDIAESGFQRVYNNKGDVDSRAQQFLEIIRELQYD
jgi:spore maturation protein CgeB